MATLNQKYPTLVDLAQMPGNKDASDIIDIAKQFNPILEDALALPCNSGLKHKTTIRTGLPNVTWMKLYQGIQPSKSTRQMVEDTTGMVETRAEVDARLIDVLEKAEDKQSMRMSEAEGHIEALSQEVASSIFYGDSSIEPEKMMGIAPRFNSLSTAENSSQVFTGNGTGGNLTSIYLITWAKNAVHLIYPNKQNFGIKREAWPGKVDAKDSNQNSYPAYREDFSWHIGVSVRNWQYVCRIANIDVGNLKADAVSGANIVDLMTDAYYAHKGRRAADGKTFWYMTTTLCKFLDLQSRLIKDSNNHNLVTLRLDETGPNAKEVLSFRGIVIRETDAISENEDQVLA